MYGRIRCLVCAVIAAAFVATMLPGAALAQGDAPATADYKQKPISLDVQEAEIGTVLRSMAGFSGTNIVASPRVTGR